jgi:hypothetical protein
VRDRPNPGRELGRYYQGDDILIKDTHHEKIKDEVKFIKNVNSGCHEHVGRYL